MRVSGVGGGGSILTNTCYYSGLIDDFRCYNTEVGSYIIQQAFNNGLGSEYASGATYQINTILSGIIFNGLLETIQYKGKAANKERAINIVKNGIK